MSISMILYSILTFSWTRCPTCCFRNTCSLISYDWSILKSLSILAMSSRISFKVSLVTSVALCSKVANSERKSCTSFLLSINSLEKSWIYNYKSKFNNGMRKKMSYKKITNFRQFHCNFWNFIIFLLEHFEFEVW